MQAHQDAYNKIAGTPSGLENLGKSLHGAPRALATAGRIPLQILDALGQAFFPRFEAAIPGTPGHHRMDIAQARGVVNEDIAQRGAESKEELEHAQAEKDLTPTAGKDPTNAFEQWRRQNPEAPVSDWLKLEASSKAAPAEKGTVHEDAEGNMWVVSPDGTAKAVTANGKQIQGKQPVQKEGTVHTDADGKMWIVHSDGTATPVSAQGEQLKGKSAEAKTPLEERIVDEYMKAHPKATLAQARRATEANPPDRGTNVIDPATHRLIRVEPGGAVPEGAITPQQAGGEAVAANKTEQAGKDARASAGRAYQLAQKLAADNTGSSDAALLMQFIGATKPEGMARIRFNKSEQDFIQGSRSLIDKAESTLTGIVDKGQRLTPADRQRYLHTMAIIAGQEGGGGGGGAYKAGDTRVVNGTTYQRDDKGQWHPQAH